MAAARAATYRVPPLQHRRGERAAQSLWHRGRRRTGAGERRCASVIGGRRARRRRRRHPSRSPRTRDGRGAAPYPPALRDPPCAGPSPTHGAGRPLPGFPPIPLPGSDVASLDLTVTLSAIVEPEGRGHGRIPHRGARAYGGNHHAHAALLRGGGAARALGPQRTRLSAVPQRGRRPAAGDPAAAPLRRSGARHRPAAEHLARRACRAARTPPRPPARRAATPGAPHRHRRANARDLGRRRPHGR